VYRSYVFQRPEFIEYFNLAERSPLPHQMPSLIPLLLLKFCSQVYRSYVFQRPEFNEYFNLAERRPLPL
jgi:hypothetical protein